MRPGGRGCRGRRPGLARKNSRRMLTRLTRAVGELVVQAVLQADRVVAEDHGVHVVAEGNGGVAELADPVEWSRRRVMPILTMLGPKAPTLEIT